MTTADKNRILEAAKRNDEESILAFVTTLGFEEVEFVGLIRRFHRSFVG